MRLKNKTVIITGGSSGIGKAIAQRFIQEGATVIVFGRNKPHYDGVFKKVDITNENLIKEAFKEISHLDILVNNAGIYFQSPVEETTNEQLDTILAVDFKAPFLMSKYALPLLKESKGNIINIASSLGVVPEPEAPAYCSIKAAVIMLTKCMSQEYATDNVRVNAVLPGAIDTPLLNPYFPTRESLEEHGKKKPFGRIGKPEEVANVALFLASDEASFVTGGLYSVDGGESVSSIYSKL